MQYHGNFFIVKNDGSLSEPDVVAKLTFEKKNRFICPSFPTIGGAGKNGAIIHYQPSKSSIKKFMIVIFCY